MTIPIFAIILCQLLWAYLQYFQLQVFIRKTFRQQIRLSNGTYSIIQYRNCRDCWGADNQRENPGIPLRQSSSNAALDVVEEENLPSSYFSIGNFCSSMTEKKTGDIPEITPRQLGCLLDKMSRLYIYFFCCSRRRPRQVSIRRRQEGAMGGFVQKFSNNLVSDLNLRISVIDYVLISLFVIGVLFDWVSAGCFYRVGQYDGLQIYSRDISVSLDPYLKALVAGSIIGIIRLYITLYSLFHQRTEVVNSIKAIFSTQPARALHL